MMPLCFLLLLFAAQVTSDQAAIDRISPDSLRGNLSFLASDALEGRDTPSRGLTVAAEFIASRFRAAGLEPVGGDYLQTTDFSEVTQKFDGFQMPMPRFR
jgi:hypothetical protein